MSEITVTCYKQFSISPEKQEHYVNNINVVKASNITYLRYLVIKAYLFI